MKKRILAIIFCLTGMVQAQQIVEDNFRQLQVIFTVDEPRMEKVVIDGRTFTQLTLEGMMPSAQVGAPNLPTWSALIEVPVCSDYEVTVCSDYEVTVSGVVYDTLAHAINQSLVAPVQPSRSKSDRGAHPLVLDEKVYATDAFFAAAPLATVEAVGMARDRGLARLQFSPVSYNPVSGQLVVCRQATVTVTYTGADEKASMDLYARYHSPLFAAGQASFNSLYPKSVQTAAPVRYLIVAHSMFRGQLDNFVTWKRRKGFLTDIVYTDDAGVGTTSTSIAAYVKSQYDNATAANPAPTYLLLVGDNEQIPAFDARVTSPDNDHITDLYYACWTSGDHIPDCYYGRFSAQTVAQLTPQIEKTLMYEQYTFDDPSFLDRAVMVAGVDNGSSGDYGYTYGDPAMDYAVTNYVNGAHGFSQVKYFKNDVSIVPSATNVTVGSNASSNAATVRSYYNQGAGWINYTAHGSETGWYMPSLSVSEVNAMTNSQKFGIMIGNCCLTNRFQVATCLGESLLRKGDYCGAVGYIGGSNSTYWDDDFYWAVGVRSGIGPTMSLAYDASHLGAYDRLFHTHGEAQSQWATSQGSVVMLGNMSVESSTSSKKHYYWEIYHLMGDPSVMTYLTQAQQMPLTASAVLMVGTTTLSVTAAPYAYVAFTDTLTHTLWASGFADASGSVTLTIPTAIAVGGYELSASAQQYRTAFQSVSVVPASGPYPVVVSVVPTTPLVAGSTVPLRIAVANLGSANATGVEVTLGSSNTQVSLSAGSVSIGSIAAGDTVYVTSVSASASAQTADGTRSTVTTHTQWTGSSTQSTFSTPLTVDAPAMAMTVIPSATNLLPDSNMTVSVNLVNNGHAASDTSQVTLTTGNPLMTVTGGPWTELSLQPGATTSHQFQLHAAATIDTDIYVPVYVHLGGTHPLDDTLRIYIGRASTETFEGGGYQLQGWVQENLPWVLTSDQAYEGIWSARSAANMGNNTSSEMSIAFHIDRADSLSFYYKVSSEANYDKFHCYLDGTEKTVASGLVDWTREAFLVSAGDHTLKFSYTKDGSQSQNSDCAWVDNVSLPNGAHVTNTGSGSGGGSGEVAAFENLIATFESADDDSRWTLANGTLYNVWTFGTAVSSGGNRSLYISNDNGQTNAYNNSNSTSVFAYTTLWLDTGAYNASFDWRCNGESNYDYLRATLLPANVTLTASVSQPSGWSYNSLPAGAIAIDGGQKLNLSTTWSTQESVVQITQAGWYNLIFYWRNDYSDGNMPPAAIDNVRLMRNIHYNVTVNADHGTTTGSGSYLLGETATVGVYPEAGYAFAGWNDGNSDNPRQLVVDGNRTLEALLTQGGGSVIMLHDTVVTVVHDTVVTVEYDSVVLTQHDTTYITLTDTLTLTEYVPVHDTVVTVEYDSVVLIQYDTTYITLTDTTYITDTLTLTEYVPVHDTVVTVEYDSVVLIQYDTTYITLTDTTYITDTLTLTEYVPVHDTVVTVEYDSVVLIQYDTTYITLTDTTYFTDTLTLTEYVPVYDTVVTVEYDSVVLIQYDTTYITLTDTTYITDTLTLTEYVPVYDTVVTVEYDSVVLIQYDTTYITLTDTTYITDTLTLTEYVLVYDTVVTVEYDSVVLIQYDTTYITDTLTLTEYVPVHDTVVTVEYDSVVFFQTDTILLTDTIVTVKYDSVVLTLTDTIYITLIDTIIIHDTVYVPQEGIGDIETHNVKLYQRNGQIVIEGAEGETVTMYDVIGRPIQAIKQSDNPTIQFDAPASGTYLIKVGNAPARRIVVIR